MKPSTWAAAHVSVGISTVYRTKRRFVEEGWALAGDVETARRLLE
jgi:transposase